MRVLNISGLLTYALYLTKNKQIEIIHKNSENLNQNEIDVLGSRWETRAIDGDIK